MNYKKIYQSYLEMEFDNHGKDIEATIIWMHRNPGDIPNDVKDAKKTLSQRDRNEIIRDILYPF